MFKSRITGENLRNYLDFNNISPSELGERIGKSRQSISNFFKSERLTQKTAKVILAGLKVSENTLLNYNSEFVAEHEPVIKGTIKRCSNSDFINRFVELEGSKKIIITPLIEQPAQAGFLGHETDNEYLDHLPNHSIIVDSYQTGRFYSFRVIGESMDNGTSESILDGSIVTAREIEREQWNSRYQLNQFKDYVIYHQEGIVVARITNHDTENGTITIHSMNDSGKFPDHKLLLDECKMILNVVSVYIQR